MSERNYLAGRFKSKTKGDKIIIRGLANAKVVDRGRDLVNPQAFTKNGGLDDFKINPMILFNHNPDFPVGKALAIAATEDGLAVEVEVTDSDDPESTRIRNNVKQGILKTFSIGFETVDEEQDGDGVNHINEAKLFEISIVSIPMNQASTFEMISKCKKDRAYCIKSLDELEKEAEEEKELRVGKTGVTNDHAHDVSVESETGDGNTVGTLGEDHAQHEHKIVDGVVQPGGEDDHTHSLDMDSLTIPDPEAPQDEESPAEDRSDKTDEQKSEAETDSDAEQKDEGLAVQTLIFAKGSFDEAEAMQWAEEHAFKADKVDETEDSYRIRQRDPADFVEDSLKTVPLTDGVQAVMGKLSEEMGQKGVEQEMDAPTVPLNTDKSDDDFGNPHLETAKQTNVLLGQVIGELQKLQNQVMQLQTASVKDEDNEALTVNESEVSNADNLSDAELTDKLQDEEEVSAKSFLESSNRYLSRLDERLKLMGV